MTATQGRSRAFWTFRIIETGLLVAALVGILLFAWSIVDIVRIETAAPKPAVAASTVDAPASAEPTSGAVAEAVRELPVFAWPGIFLFFGSLIALQPVRGILMRYRRADGTERNTDKRGRVA